MFRVRRGVAARDEESAKRQQSWTRQNSPGNSRTHILGQQQRQLSRQQQHYLMQKKLQQQAKAYEIESKEAREAKLRQQHQFQEHQQEQHQLEQKVYIEQKKTSKTVSWSPTMHTHPLKGGDVGPTTIKIIKAGLLWKRDSGDIPCFAANCYKQTKCIITTLQEK